MTIFEQGETAPLVLIADDDPSIVSLLAERFGQMRFKIETATNGKDALRRIRQGGVDTLIVDVQMPELDGLSVSAHLLEYSKRPLHVIVATGLRDAATVAICDSMGALYVRKDPNFWKNLEAALIEIYPAKAERISRSGLRSTAVPRRARVLLVDDDPDVESFIRTKLDQYGIDTLYAADTTQGYLMACKEEPDAIISDYAMPKGDAQYFLAQLRATPETKNIPVIVLTGRDLSRANKLGLYRRISGQRGAAQILRKSADTDELFGVLQRCCGLGMSLA